MVKPFFKNRAGNPVCGAFGADPSAARPQQGEEQQRKKKELKEKEQQQRSRLRGQGAFVNRDGGRRRGGGHGRRLRRSRGPGTACPACAGGRGLYRGRSGSGGLPGGRGRRGGGGAHGRNRLPLRLVAPQHRAGVVALKAQGDVHAAAALAALHCVVAARFQNGGAVPHGQLFRVLGVFHRRDPQQRGVLGQHLHRHLHMLHRFEVFGVGGGEPCLKDLRPGAAHLLVRGLPGKARAGIHLAQRAAIHRRQPGWNGVVLQGLQDVELLHRHKAGAAVLGRHHRPHVPGARLAGRLGGEDAALAVAVCVHRLAVPGAGMGRVGGFAVGPVLYGQRLHPGVAHMESQRGGEGEGAVGVAVGHQTAVGKAGEQAVLQLRAGHAGDALRVDGQPRLTQVEGGLALGQLHLHRALAVQNGGGGRRPGADAQQLIAAGHQIGEKGVGAQVQKDEAAALDAQPFKVWRAAQIQLGDQGVGAPEVQQGFVVPQGEGLEGPAHVDEILKGPVARDVQRLEEVVAAGQLPQKGGRRGVQGRQAVAVAVQHLQPGRLGKVQPGEPVIVAQQAGQARGLVQGQFGEGVADAVQLGEGGEKADAFQRADALAAHVQHGHRRPLALGKGAVAVGVEGAHAGQKGRVGEVRLVQRHRPFSGGEGGVQGAGGGGAAGRGGERGVPGYRLFGGGRKGNSRCAQHKGQHDGRPEKGLFVVGHGLPHPFSQSVLGRQGRSGYAAAWAF